MRTAIEGDRLNHWEAHLHDASAGLGVPAVFLRAGKDCEATWCGVMARTTGIRVAEPKRRTAALLLIAVDGGVYAIAHDEGFRLLPEDIKDPRFGLSFAIRQIDPQQVRGLVAYTLGQARTDIAIVPGGIPVPSLGIREYAQLVSRIGGYLDNTELTYSQYGRGKTTSAEGGSGLRLRLGVEPADLIADVREISRICREVEPQQGLEFVEHLVPVRDPKTREVLDSALDDALGRFDDGAITISVPADYIGAYEEAVAFGVKIGAGGPKRVDDLAVGHLLDCVRTRKPGLRLEALREGRVYVYQHDAADLPAATKALRWIEAETSLGERRFCLLDQSWYEIGAIYRAEVKNVISRVISPTPSMSLPPWPRGVDEETYNRKLSEASEGRGFINLDRAYVKNPLKRRDVLEVSDHLTPDGTLVLVKPAHGRSGPLSHLFNQGLVAVQMLQNSAAVRAEFARVVRERSGGRRRLPENFVPRRLVFAIHLKRGTELTPDTLFAFSQVTLAQTVKTLQQWGVTVEVIGIPDGGPNAAHDNVEESAA
ncbi:TIGR04141 family sporadically distributed protein [Streptomyces diastatochromogenes]|nr:TIGR04141 family sporadically distributed protein [Streptomyces diastatochromogenes]